MKAKKIMVISIMIVVIYISYILFVRSQIKTIDIIPSIFNSNQFSVSHKFGGTFLFKGQQDITPIAHDEENLYVLNGKGNSFVMHNIFWSYFISNNNEIVIEKNIIDITRTKKPQYQIVTVPKRVYTKLIKRDCITIRIDFINGYQLLVYNLKTKDYFVKYSNSEGK